MSSSSQIGEVLKQKGFMPWDEADARKHIDEYSVFSQNYMCYSNFASTEPVMTLAVDDVGTIWIAGALFDLTELGFTYVECEVTEESEEGSMLSYSSYTTRRKQ